MNHSQCSINRFLSPGRPRGIHHSVAGSMSGVRSQLVNPSQPALAASMRRLVYICQHLSRELRNMSNVSGSMAASPLYLYFIFVWWSWSFVRHNKLFLKWRFSINFCTTTVDSGEHVQPFHIHLAHIVTALWFWKEQFHYRIIKSVTSVTALCIR